MYQDYHAFGFEPLAVNLGENINTVKNFARQYSFTFLCDPPSPNRIAWPLYRINGYIPLNYVIDTTMTVQYGAEGFDESVIRAYIEYLLPPTGISAEPKHATTLQLSAIPSLTSRPAQVQFTLARPSPVTVRVYASSGRLIRTLYKGRADAGVNWALWNLQDDDGMPVSAGRYFYEVTTASISERIPVSVIR